IVRRAENGGQTRAALEGFAASAGPYVIFLDADDLLLPNCVETHVFVHLSLRVHVGFTSGDMLQLAGDQVVLGTEHAFNQVMQTGRGIKPRAARPYRHPFGEAWPPPNLDCGVLKTIRFVGPTSRWVWSPTSGNCFRRDALCLFADNPALQSLKTGTDLYFCLGINAVSGSVLIDAPVAVYRLHGGNIYSQRPQLNHVLCYEPGGTGDSNASARAALVDHLIERADRFVGRGWISRDFLWLLWQVDCENPDPRAPGWARRSRGAAALVKNYGSISPLLGRWPIKAWLALRFLPLKVISALEKNSAGKLTPRA
ncbi:MAG: glycosyltransferase, partial [Methylocella sp.]